MASQNPSHRSIRPKPLATPRANPLETMSRRLGKLSSNGLSVHLGVHGRINSRTPNVAQRVTNNRARIRISHMCQAGETPRFPFVFAGAGDVPLLLGSTRWSWSDAAGEIVF